MDYFSSLIFPALFVTGILGKRIRSSINLLGLVAETHRWKNALAKKGIFDDAFLYGCVSATTPSKQVGVAAWLECWLSHLGVAGSSPGRDNL